MWPYLKKPLEVIFDFQGHKSDALILWADIHIRKDTRIQGCHSSCMNTHKPMCWHSEKKANWKPRISAPETILFALWCWISNLHNCVKINACHVSHTVSIILSWWSESSNVENLLQAKNATLNYLQNINAFYL